MRRIYRIDRTEKDLFCKTELCEEEWRRIDEIPFLWASSLGRLHWNFTRRGARYSLTTNGSHKGNNYYEVSINKKRYLVHRIVAHAFIDDTLPLKCINKHDKSEYQVDHIDTNPSNNRLDNLRIVSAKENSNNPLTRKHAKEATPLRIRRGKDHWHYGKGISEETRKRMSEAHKGQIVSEATKEILRNVNKRNNRAFKGVVQAIKNGVVVAKFNNWFDIAEFVNTERETAHSTINYAIKVRKVLYGYQWNRITN